MPRLYWHREEIETEEEIDVEETKEETKEEIDVEDTNEEEIDVEETKEEKDVEEENYLNVRVVSIKQVVITLWLYIRKLLIWG